MVVLAVTEPRLDVQRDEKLILPINSSLSGTIDIDAMCSTTTITASKTFTADTMSLNDK